MTRREFVLGLAAAALYGRQQARPPLSGEAVFARLLERVKPGPIGETAAKVAGELVGTPYAGGTLERFAPAEICSVDLLGLDCVTLYETALCFARMLAHGGRTPADLLREITFTRYRAGKLDGYLSRLHYTSDWLFDNVAKGVIADVTPELHGAERMHKRFDFMSAHPDLYPQLKANPALVVEMEKREDEIGRRDPWFVPSAKVQAIEPLLRSGDIIGIATTLAGLDCSHTGLISVDGAGARRFLHASSIQKKVVIGETISAYVLRSPRNLGVMVGRPL